MKLFIEAEPQKSSPIHNPYLKILNHLQNFYRIIFLITKYLLYPMQISFLVFLKIFISIKFMSPFPFSE